MFKGKKNEIDFSISDLKDRNCAIFKAAQVSDTTKEESSSYTFEIEDDIYIFPGHEEDIFLYHNDTHWIYKDGVNGVPIDVCLYTEGEVVTLLQHMVLSHHGKFSVCQHQTYRRLFLRGFQQLFLLSLC